MMFRSASLSLGQRQVCKGNGHFRYRLTYMYKFILWASKQMMLIQPTTHENILEIAPL